MKKYVKADSKDKTEIYNLLNSDKISDINMDIELIEDILWSIDMDITGVEGDNILYGLGTNSKHWTSIETEYKNMQYTINQMKSKLDNILEITEQTIQDEENKL